MTGGWTLTDLASRLGGTVEGPGDRVITAVRPLHEAGPSDLSFLANPKYRAALARTRAAGVLLAPGEICPDGVAAVRVSDPYRCLGQVLMWLDPGLPPIVGRHPTSVVAADAELADDVALGPGACVGSRARLGRGTRLAAHAFVESSAVLGEGCYLYPGAYVGRGCVLGDRVVLHPGVVVGADGFGYSPLPDGGWAKIPQLGIVRIGDDVEIGANSCVDRATLGETVIGRGTKIDNLVQIAHNAAISENGAIAAQSGIAGSTRIGKRVRMGGQAGIPGHLTIGDDVTISAQAGVTRDIPDGQSVTGFPARPVREFFRSQALVKRLPDLERRLQSLEKRAPESEEAP
ncbi:MAG: UDP-3-O-(3-hydroxymyristoyl)glucosamine N-acyltransferase [Gemmatimonadetes bacterium]|nr:UDP-3-O-(3-hydroxymyristoyl)glucosamine N-acyltransferase [Gemmatimonadota bacterium]